MKLLFIWLLFATIYYCVKILKFWLGTFRLDASSAKASSLPCFSVIVPARNEEAHIRRCLESLIRQDYPKDRYEVIVVDDHSSDRTPDIVREYQRQFPTLVRLIPNEQPAQTRAFKKVAIQKGIGHSRHEIIATIDADCWAQRGWLSGLARYFESDVGLVAGVVTMQTHPKSSWFEKIQALEFLALVTAGAGSMGMGNPIICNGANLSYRKKAFQEVRGFEAIDSLPSGDDDLLLQKIHHLSSWRVRFSSASETINFTEPLRSIRSFLNQRARWASKISHYRKKGLVFFLVLTYLFYLTLFFLAPLSVILGGKWLLVWVSFAAKAAVDFLVAYRGCKMTSQRPLIKYFLLAEFLQIPYILWAGIQGLRGRFSWKDRVF